MAEDGKGFCATVEDFHDPKKRAAHQREKSRTQESQSFEKALRDENAKTLSFYEKGEVADSRAELVEANKDIALNRSPNSLTITYESNSRKDLAAATKTLCDFLAQHWGYKTIDHMIAVAQVEFIAKAIADPIKFAPSALKAISQIQEQIHPQEKVTAKETIPSGGKSEIVKRINEHYRNPQPKPD